jgi:ABC-2 type transport system permease protein
MAVQLRELLDTSAAVRLVDLSPDDDAGEEVSSGRLAAAVLVPAGFSEGTLAGQAVQVTVIADQAAGSSQAAEEAVRTMFVRALSAAQSSRMSVAALDAGGAGDQQAIQAEALSAAVLAWQAPPLSIRREMAQARTDTTQIPTGYAQSSPGMIVMFGVFGLMTSASLLVAERKTRTLQRLITTNMSRAEILGGHAVAVGIVALAQQAILVVAGQVIFGVDFLHEPIGLLLVMLGLALWVTCLGLLVGVLAHDEQQVVIFALITMFIFSAMGGAWFPLEVTGKTFAAIGHVFPSAWAMDGFQNLLVRGLGLQSVLLPVGIMAGYALAFLALAVWRFREE